MGADLSKAYGKGYGDTGGAGYGTQSDPPPTLPPVKPFTDPMIYSPKTATTQAATFNPQSSSHNYLARFGGASHF